MSSRTRPERQSYVVGVAGGSGSGKSTVVRQVVRALGDEHVTVLQHDAYYRDLAHLPFEVRAASNFDHPESLETELLAEHLRALRAGRPVEVPTYDFERHVRRAERRRVAPAPIVLLDGILVLSEERLRRLLDLAVFVHADADERLARRLRRDTRDRGRSPESVREQFHATVLPMHDRWVEPSRVYADFTIVGGGFNRRAVGEVVARLRAEAGLG